MSETLSFWFGDIAETEGLCLCLIWKKFNGLRYVQELPFFEEGTFSLGHYFRSFTIDSNFDLNVFSIELK